MVAFEISKLLRKIAGDPKIGGASRYVYIIASVLTSLLMSSIILSLLVNVILDVNGNMPRALTALSPVFGLLPMIITHWHLFWNRSHLYLLFDDMETIVNERE